MGKYFAFVFTAVASIFIASLVLAASATLVWQDNSNNEDGFIIYRNLNGGPMGKIAAVKTDVKTYIDTTLVTPAAVPSPGPAASNNYCYQVTAQNTAGEAAPTNQACATVLGSITPPTVTIPAAASNLTATPSSQLRAAPQTKGKTTK